MGSKQGNTRKGGQIGGNFRDNSPKTLGLTEMSIGDGGWAVLRRNKLIREKAQRRGRRPPGSLPGSQQCDGGPLGPFLGACTQKGAPSLS